MNRSLGSWLLLACAALALLPWHQQDAGLWAFEWLAAGASADVATATAWSQVLQLGRDELGPLIGAPVLAAVLALLPWPRARRGAALAALAAVALLWLGARGSGPGLRLRRPREGRLGWFGRRGSHAAGPGG